LIFKNVWKIKSVKKEIKIFKTVKNVFTPVVLRLQHKQGDTRQDIHRNTYS